MGIYSTIDKILEGCLSIIASPDQKLKDGARVVITVLEQDLQSLLSRIYERLDYLRTK
jgi:hypothetical protein